MRRTIATLTALAGLAAGAWGQSFTTVALTGQEAPGVEPGVVFDRPSPPALGGEGSVVFFSTLAGDDLSEDLDEGVFICRDSGASLVVRESDGAPWYAPDTRFVGLSDFAIDRDGMVVLAASVDDPAVTDGPTKARALGVFTQVGPTAFAALARIDEQAAGLPDGDLYETLNSPSVAPNGQSFFTGGRPDDGLDSYAKGMWTDRTGSTSLLVRPGDAAPGTGGAVFANVESPVPGAGGGFLFRGSFRPEGSEDPATTGLWREVHGAIAAVAFAGDPAPGTAGSFTAFASRPALNGLSQTVFKASIDVPGCGVWTDRSGALALLVREGDAAPDAPGATIGRISPQVAMNDAGDVVFRCFLNGADTYANGAVYLASAGGGFALVAREGDAIDDEPGDVRIATLGDPLINQRGEIVFTAQLAGASVGPETNSALLALDTGGRLYTVVREGDPIDPDGAGDRVVRGVYFDSAAHDRGRDPLGEGRVGFALSFTDGSHGAFVAEIGYTSPADLNGDGVVDSRDFVAFLGAFAAGDPTADFNRDGTVDTRDFVAFLAVWSRDRG